MIITIVNRLNFRQDKKGHAVKENVTERCHHEITDYQNRADEPLKED